MDTIPDFYVMANPSACLAVRRVCPYILLFFPGRNMGLHRLWRVGPYMTNTCFPLNYE